MSNPDDDDSVEKLALVMFDTRTIKGLDFNPFSDNNVLKLNSVQEYPQDLYFILRTVLMFRGMAQARGRERPISLALRHACCHDFVRSRRLLCRLDLSMLQESECRSYVMDGSRCSRPAHGVSYIFPSYLGHHPTIQPSLLSYCNSVSLSYVARFRPPPSTRCRFVVHVRSTHSPEPGS